MKSMSRFLLALIPALAVSLASSVAAPQQLPNPDFTKGEPIPEGATHDWTLGATGARGWMYSHQLETTKARQIRITAVAKGSPADGVLEIGDVILGVAGGMFQSDPRVEFGRALTAAETEAARGQLKLTRWRDGRTREVVVKLPVLGTYSATAPYDCRKSARILQMGCKALAERMQQPDYERSQSPITRSLNALALLASGESEYLPLVKRETEWASGYSVQSMATWYYGYVLALLAEYQLATGDKTYEDGLRRIAMEAANGQSIVGSWGHKFAGPDGRLVGYGMMNAPGLPLTTALILAREAGVKEPQIDLAIDRSAKFLRFYIGKGAIPYGDHHPWVQTHEDNGKCGMTAVMFNLMGEEKGTEFFARMSLASHGSERDTGHTGNFWNMTWAMPAVALSGPEAAGAWMREFGAWYYDLARGWDGSFRHQGPPQPRPDSTGRWDATGAYLLAYAMPLEKIHLTGKSPSIAPQLDAETVAQTLRDGRGWSNSDRNSAYDSLKTDQLLERLSSWSPIVRERAASALARRKDVAVEPIVKLLDSPDLNTRLGACKALGQLGDRAAPAVPALRDTLKADDMWLRLEAAAALAGIGEPAMAAAPDMLEMLAREPGPDDPRGMEQRYLCFALFNRDGLLGKSLDGVDRDLLMKAVRAGLKNQDGRARGAIGSVYQSLGFEALKPLLPAIHEAIHTPSPSGIMFSEQIRMAGLELFTKHRVAEGIDLMADYIRHQKHHGSEKRQPVVLQMLESYGKHAQRVLPQLEAAADYNENDPADYPRKLSLEKAQGIRESIERIKAATDEPSLISINDA
ncbi:MAG TPA: DUF6288 domain-containing protein [Luteolibacter sp.]|nr:DUF6288 domain-containing protein [Luteolibacter sp.]